MKKLTRIFNQLLAQNVLDDIKKTNLAIKPCLVSYLDSENNNKIQAFCWVAQDKNTTTTVYIHAFAEDRKLDIFDVTNIQIIEAPKCFVCNHGAFALQNDIIFGTQLAYIDSINSSSMAQKFAKEYNMDSSNLVLCSLHDRHDNLVNVAWIDLTSPNKDCIPVWYDENFSFCKKYIRKPLAIGSEFRFNNCVYVVCKTFGEVYIKEKSLVRFGPHMGCPHHL